LRGIKWGPDAVHRSLKKGRRAPRRGKRTLGAIWSGKNKYEESQSPQSAPPSTSGRGGGKVHEEKKLGKNTFRLTFQKRLRERIGGARFRASEKARKKNSEDLET